MTSENNVNSEPGATDAPDQEEAVESFADLLKEDYLTPVRMEPGQKVDAVVVRISNEWIFLDLGGKSEGCLAKGELVDSEGQITVSEGDVLQVYFLSSRKNEMLFTTKVGAGAARAHLEEAFRSGIPVEGHVEKEIKGGFEIKIPGNIRGFCPYSQMDLRRIEQAESYIGQVFSFRITEFGEQGRNIIVSRRVLLEEERRLKKEELRESLETGMTVKGTITSVKDFGAFVDIGGVEGLIPISEVAWGRVEDINTLLAAGQEVDVEVVKLDWENDRYSFSLKNAMPDPWDNLSEKYTEGSFYTGKVARLTAFGAFVTLEPGVDGLLHISKLGRGRRINHPREVVTEGQEIDVRIDSLDFENRRLSLSLAAAAEDEKQQEKDEAEIRSYMKTSTAGKSGSFGTLGELMKAKLAGKK